MNPQQLEAKLEENARQIVAREDERVRIEDESKVASSDIENKEHIERFVSEALRTNASKNELRRACLLSNSKQGRFANRGLIMESVLKQSFAISVKGGGAPSSSSFVDRKNGKCSNKNIGHHLLRSPQK
eukprot:15209434-Ditylum_brightwellii.AAC.1